MDLWMGIFHTLLTYDNAEIRSDVCQCSARARCITDHVIS
jgi:hypothetical protein